MAQDFECRPEILNGVAQSLLEMKKMARSLEQSADALRPIATENADKLLDEVEKGSREIADKVGFLYRRIAKEAMS